MPLNKDEILSADDRTAKAVPVPEWGGEVLIAPLSAEVGEEFVERSATGKRKNANVWLVARSIVDADGQQMFDDAEVSALAKKSAKAIKRVLDEVLELNGLTAKAVDAAEKN